MWEQNQYNGHHKQVVILSHLMLKLKINVNDAEKIKSTMMKTKQFAGLLKNSWKQYSCQIITCLH